MGKHTKTNADFCETNTKPHGFNRIPYFSVYIVAYWYGFVNSFCENIFVFIGILLDCFGILLFKNLVFWTFDRVSSRA